MASLPTNAALTASLDQAAADGVRRTGRRGAKAADARRRRNEQYPLDQGARSAFSTARQWAAEYLRRGVRQSHGIGPNRPLTAAERRDFETLDRVLGRIFDGTRSW